MLATWLAISGALAVPPNPDVEIGTTRRFGVGLGLGFPATLTAKMHVNREHGVSLHVGPTLGVSGLEVRLQYEHTPWVIRTWNVAELDLSWHAGVVVDFVFGEQASRSGVRPGLLAGVGVEARFVPFPVGLFAELSPVVYPVDIVDESSPFLPASVVIVVGARWYL